MIQQSISEFSEELFKTCFKYDGQIFSSKKSPETRKELEKGQLIFTDNELIFWNNEAQKGFLMQYTMIILHGIIRHITTEIECQQNSSAVYCQIGDSLLDDDDDDLEYGDQESEEESNEEEKEPKTKTKPIIELYFVPYLSNEVDEIYQHLSKFINSHSLPVSDDELYDENTNWEDYEASANDQHEAQELNDATLSPANKKRKE